MSYPYTLSVPVTITTPIEDLYYGALVIDKLQYPGAPPSCSQSEILFNLLTCGTDPKYLCITLYPETAPDLTMSVTFMAYEPWEDILTEMYALFPEARTLDEALVFYLLKPEYHGWFNFTIDHIDRPESAHEMIMEAVVIGAAPDV